MEPQWNSESHFAKMPLEECSRLIPVFCFDSREEQIFNSKTEYLHFRNETIEQVSELRERFLQKGSNLLIVNGSYEVLIPSLARVLQVNEVITNEGILSSKWRMTNLAEFRKSKIKEIDYNLTMHSISMQIEKTFNTPPFFTDTIHLPPFPEINPGKVPLKSIYES